MEIAVQRPLQMLRQAGSSGILAASARCASLRRYSTSSRQYSTAADASSSTPYKYSSSSSVNSDEVSKFARASEEWWDPRGQFEMLHKMNSPRVRYIRSFVEREMMSSDSVQRPFKGLKMLDVGCGGGLLSESLARLGAEVTGIDAAPENIAMAEIHLRNDPLLQPVPRYIASTAEDLADTTSPDGLYDVVCALEIIEHVNNPDTFIESCAKLIKPGGLLFVSTINRTPTSYLFTILLAEHVLRWVPPGTHDHSKYITVEEMNSYFSKAGCERLDTTGMSYDIVGNRWNLLGDFREPDGFAKVIGDIGDLEMNYIACSKKK